MASGGEDSVPSPRGVAEWIESSAPCDLRTLPFHGRRNGRRDGRRRERASDGPLPNAFLWGADGVLSATARRALEERGDGFQNLGRRGGLTRSFPLTTISQFRKVVATGCGSAW